jgi:cardiolipin synthase
MTAKHRSQTATKYSAMLGTIRLSAAFLVTALLLAGCASPPPTPGADPDLIAADAGADPARSLDIMRQQEERIARKPFLHGNRVELLINGPAAFAALAAAINGATARIDMESYEFDQQAGGQFSDLLLAARARGVEVNLIYDAWGALDTPAALFDRLRQGGVRVLEYNPLRPNDRVPILPNHRDHRKLLCVDGLVAITGGVNISRVYENRPNHYAADANDQAWRDTDVRIEGPVVAQFEHYFMETWRDQKGPPLAPPPPTPGTARGPSLVQAIDGAPESGHPLIYRTLLAAIELARKSVHLTTGYFVPTPDLARVLERTARRRCADRRAGPQRQRCSTRRRTRRLRGDDAGRRGHPRAPAAHPPRQDHRDRRRLVGRRLVQPGLAQRDLEQRDRRHHPRQGVRRQDGGDVRG